MHYLFGTLQVEKFTLPVEELQKRYPQIACFHYVSSFTGDVSSLNDLRETYTWFIYIVYILCKNNKSSKLWFEQGVKKLADHLMEVALQEKYMGEKIPEAWLKFEAKILG